MLGWEPKPKTIYAMVDPRNGLVRYVGATTYALERRLVFHAHPRNPNQVMKDWIAELADLGLKPEMKVLEYAEGGLSGFAREQHWILQMHAEGNPLINHQVLRFRNGRPSKRAYALRPFD